MKHKRPTWRHLLFYFTSYVLNMFWSLIYPSSGACYCSVELQHRSFCSWFVVCWRYGAVGFEWCRCCRLQLLMMDILMIKTCWVHKKLNKIANDVKFFFYASTIVIIICVELCVDLLCVWWHQPSGGGVAVSAGRNT